MFSYHSSRATKPKDHTGRKVSTLLTDNPIIKRLPKTQPWFRRVRRIIFLLLAATLSVYCLSLSRSPKVVILPGSHNQILLRDLGVYSHAAGDILSRSLLNSSKLTINTKRVAQNLEQQFPELGEVSVTISLAGRQPRIYVQPARPALLLKSVDGGVFVLDDTGRALINSNQVAKVEELGLDLVNDKSNLSVIPGKAALPGSDVLFIKEVAGQLKAKKLVIAALTLPQEAPNQLDVRVAGVPYIIKFNLRGDGRTQAGTYLAVRAQLEREHKVPGSYIDVRVEDRAYYK